MSDCCQESSSVRGGKILAHVEPAPVIRMTGWFRLSGFPRCHGPGISATVTSSSEVPEMGPAESTLIDTPTAPAIHIGRSSLLDLTHEFESPDFQALCAPVIRLSRQKRPGRLSQGLLLRYPSTVRASESFCLPPVRSAAEWITAAEGTLAPVGSHIAGF